MTNDNFEWHETPQAALQKWFGLPSSNNEEWEAIKLLLQQEIAHLIKHDYEKLLHILYRIDLKESEAMQALQQPNAAALLTDLIIKRQLEKVESRKKNQD